MKARTLLLGALVLVSVAACTSTNPTAPNAAARSAITPDSTGGLMLNGGPGDPGDETPPDTTGDGGPMAGGGG